MGNLGYGVFPTHPGEVLKDEMYKKSGSSTLIYLTIPTSC